MERPVTTRREIAPLHLPWLQHEHFPATKVVCSTVNGLVYSSKNSLIKVVQELRRGRANVDKQLSQLDTQLLSLSDYLDGKRSTMFPPHLIMYVEDTLDITMPLAPADGRRLRGTGNAAVIQHFSDSFKKELEPPTPAMVEDDLNSESPCTTTGLWKYLYAYSFFKTITPDDMEQALLLDANVHDDCIDPSIHCEDIKSIRGGEKDKLLVGRDFQELQDNFSLSRSTTHDLDDIYMEVCCFRQLIRLVASLCAVGTPALMKVGDQVIPSQPDDEDKHANVTTETITDMETSHSLRSTDERSWNSKGLTWVLRNIGLLEGNDKEIARVGLSSPMDDEVSQEIRSLQRQLQACVRETNETKRKLRRIMAETKPWLFEEKREEEATIEKYFTMWQTKKELARKKKLREKKRQRRQGVDSNFQLQLYTSVVAAAVANL
ncbi:unnamed protein product [Peronospora destructor]|uniref:Uncharacterized protein n=1 Tax=Peronospora destructor TaxID=86335 RepID=A0AAV0V4Y9_9STRA|nr:unnamed protein product [Peronospora destructor]